MGKDGNNSPIRIPESHIKWINICAIALWLRELDWDLCFFCHVGGFSSHWFRNTSQHRNPKERKVQQARGNVRHIIFLSFEDLCCIKHWFVSGPFGLWVFCYESLRLFSEGKPRGRTSKFPKHCVEVGGVIKISDDSDSDSDEIDSESNSSPDSLQDNDDVIFVNHINGPAGRLT